MIGAASTLLLAAGILCGLIGGATGRLKIGFGIGLDLWTAAGLLRLTGELRWEPLITAALLIAVRKLIGVSRNLKIE